MDPVRSHHTRAAAVLTATAVVLTTAIFGRHAAQQADRYQLVLDGLTPFFRGLDESGTALIDAAMANDTTVALGVAGTALVAALLWRSAAMLCFTAALALAAWGEASLLHLELPAGIAFYVLAFVFAFGFGLLRPLARVRGQSALPSSPAGWPPWEALLLAALTLTALIFRTYALPQLPRQYENEMIIAMLSGSTMDGVRKYLPWGMLSNTNGIIHIYLQHLLFQWLGTSFFSLRFLSALIGTAMVPVLYWILRRIGGRPSALLGALLLITGPDQLYWTRNENTCIPLVALLCLITVALSLRFCDRPRPLGVLGLAAWIPFTRLFYSPAILLPAYPIVLYVHGLLFDRGGRRSAIFALPGLALGCALWAFSLTAAYCVVSGGQWQFLHPASSGGRPVWQGEAGAATITTGELVQKQVANLARNLGTVAAAMSYQGDFTNWYFRNDATPRPTFVNVSATVLLALGIGYLLAQLRDRGAFALLFWIGLGVLPGVMSLDPAPRRMVMAFPGFYAVAAVFLAAGWSVIAEHAHRGVAAGFRLLLAAGIAAVLWTSAASHFALKPAGTLMERIERETKRVFTESDAIYSAVDSHWIQVSTLLHANELFRRDRVPCIEAVRPQQWLAAATGESCSYEDVALQFTVSDEKRAKLRKEFDPRQISFLLPDRPQSAGVVALLTALFPRLESERLPVFDESNAWLWLRTDRDSARALRRPVLRLAGKDDDGLAGRLLENVTLDVESSPQLEGVVVEGAVLLDSDGWYRFEIEPACAGSALTIDGRRIDSVVAEPMTSGAHPATLRLPHPGACKLPLQLIARDAIQADRAPQRPMWLSPRVGTIEAARSRPVVDAVGFVEAPVPAAASVAALDFVVDTAGTITLLVSRDGGFAIQRVRPDGSLDASWNLDSTQPGGIALRPDGKLLVLYENRVVLYDRGGKEVERWEGVLARWPLLGFSGDGLTLNPMFERNGIAVLDGKGQELRLWQTFDGGPGQFRAPAAVSIDAKGNLVVVQLDGTALVFRTPTDRFEPVFERSFRIEYREPEVVPRGWALDPRGRLVVPEPGTSHVFTYQLTGERMMARDPSRDLTQQMGEEVLRIQATTDGVFVLGGRHQLRKLIEVRDD